MTKKSYDNISDFFNKHQFLYKILIVLYKTLPYITAISYSLLLITSCFFYKETTISYYFKILFIPAMVFLIITVFRKMFNQKRPYEKLNINPLVKKNTIGNSFPSRHTASAFIISMVFLYINTYLGCFFLIISTIIALTRILAGVHFIKDVLFGALFSILIGCIFIL